MKQNKNENISNIVENAQRFMPQDEQSIRIMRERAKYLAKPLLQETQKSQATDYARFKIGKKEMYGVPYKYIKEVIAETIFTKLPFTPNYITGIINHRGSLIALVNLRSLFNISTNALNKYNSSIIVEYEGSKLALQVDDINGNFQYYQDEIEPPLQSKSTKQNNYIYGLHNTKRTITSIIDIENLIKDIKTNINNIK